MREILVIDKDFKQLMDLKNNLAIEYFNKHNFNNGDNIKSIYFDNTNVFSDGKWLEINGTLLIDTMNFLFIGYFTNDINKLHKMIIPIKDLIYIGK